MNLVSDDECAVRDGLIMSPTPPPVSPLTPIDEWYNIIIIIIIIGAHINTGAKQEHKNIKRIN